MRIPDKLPGGRRLRGFTVLELTLGIAITAAVGLAVATMLFSASHGTSSQRGLRSALVSQQVAAQHLESALRASQMVLAKGDNHLVLWTGEEWANEIPNLSELIRIERDPSTNELHCYRAAAGLAAEDDTQYELSATDFNAVTSALKGSANFPQQLWGTEVTDWTVALDTTNPQDAGFVGYRVTVTLEGTSDTAVGGMGLRNR